MPHLDHLNRFLKHQSRPAIIQPTHRPYFRRTDQRIQRLVTSMLSLPRHARAFTAAALAAASFFRATYAQHACSFVSDRFSCTSTNARAFALQCTCFSCAEVDGVGSYQCSGATVCGAAYTSTSVEAKSRSWSLSAYISIGVVFLVVSVLVYATVRVLARFLRVLKDDTDKDGDDGAEQLEQRLSTRVYAYVYTWAFGSLYKADGVQKRTLGACWIAGCELLDCVWCCTKRNDRDHDWRPFYLRCMRLLASLSIGASLGMIFGSLEFDSAKCETRANVSYCVAGAMSNQQSDVTSIICDDGPAILDLETLISTASIVAFISTQCVKYVGSYAQSVGEPQTKLDVLAHVLWVLAALAAFPVCYAVSSQLLSPTAYDHKDTTLRVRLVVSVTLSTWIKDQAADVVKGPLVFACKNLLSKCLPNPNANAKKQVVEPMPMALAPPKYDANEDPADVDHAKNDQGEFELNDFDKDGKIDTMTSPRPTTTQG